MFVFVFIRSSKTDDIGELCLQFPWTLVIVAFSTVFELFSFRFGVCLYLPFFCCFQGFVFLSGVVF